MDNEAKELYIEDIIDYESMKKTKIGHVAVSVTVLSALASVAVLNNIGLGHFAGEPLADIARLISNLVLSGTAIPVIINLIKSLGLICEINVDIEEIKGIFASYGLILNEELEKSMGK